MSAVVKRKKYLTIKKVQSKSGGDFNRLPILRNPRPIQGFIKLVLT